MNINQITSTILIVLMYLFIFAFGFFMGLAQNNISTQNACNDFINEEILIPDVRRCLGETNTILIDYDFIQTENLNLNYSVPN